MLTGHWDVIVEIIASDRDQLTGILVDEIQSLGGVHETSTETVLRTFKTTYDWSRDFDAFVVPGRGYRAMLGQLEPLGADGAKAVAEYVRGGGMYIGSCAGSYNAAVVAESFLRICPIQLDMCLLDARVWNTGDTEWLGLRSPGVGILEADNAAPDHPVMAGMPAHFEITHYNGPLFTGAQHLAQVTGPSGGHFTPAEQSSAGPRRTR